jgi:hypothetical protein
MTKPQLILQDLDSIGYNNANLEQAHARIMKGGSWKKQRIVVVIPTSDMVPAKAMLSWWNLVFPPNQGVVKILAQGMEVGDAYNTAVESILSHSDLSQWEYMLTIEHDNLPPSDGVLKLVQDFEEFPEYSAIGGLYWTKGMEFGQPQIWGDKKDSIENYRPQLPALTTTGKDRMVDCWGVAMGFTMYKISMFKEDKLKKPWFKTQIDGGVSTQDLWFWSSGGAGACKYYKCAIDCSIRVGHIDMANTFGMGTDFVF